MAAAAKQARSAGDRLSALPDELRRHILSFLPAQEVVRTTVLSKKWIDLWRAVPGINLNIDDFRKRGALQSGNKIWERFEDFSTNLLVLHNAPCLDVFRLKTIFIPDDSRRNVDAWIRRAIKDNSLVLQLSFWDHYKLPHLSASPCRRLKRLDLNGLSLDHSFAEQLHSWFPHLEDLILRQCYQGFSVIQSDKLKHLEIEGCEYESEAGVFVIRAPRLSSLSLDMFGVYYGYGVSLDAGNSLMKASVDLPCEWSPRSELELLGSLFSVTSLELIGFQPAAIIDEEFDELPIFNNLKTLLLGIRHKTSYGSGDLEYYRAHRRFLQKSPNLEKLTLQEWPAAPIELPTLENLRTLILHQCNLQDDFELLRHCLQCSPNLEKLGLELCMLSDYWEGGEGGEGRANSKKAYSQSKCLVTFQCPKLKSTEIMYDEDDNIPELVSFLLGVSGRASKNAITLLPYMKK